MSNATGYTAQRAAPHEAAVESVCEEFERCGYDPRKLEPDGHRPDIRLRAIDLSFVEVKTGEPNIAVELHSLAECRRLETRGERVYFVHASASTPPTRWTVDTPDSLVHRLLKGPSRRSGNGSLDDWYLFRPGGTAFTDYFLGIEPLPMAPSCTTYPGQCDDNRYVHCPTCWRHLDGLYARCPDHPGDVWPA